MKKSIIIINLLFLFVCPVFSQGKTFIGGEFAITSDVYSVADPCNLIVTDPLLNGSFGLTIGQEINKNFLIETGLIRKYYNQEFEYHFDLFRAGIFSKPFDIWQIPLRIKLRKSVVKDRLFLIATIGYHFNFTKNSSEGELARGEIVSGNDSISYNHAVNIMSETFSLIETGVGFEFIVVDGFNISLSASYYMGFKKVQQLDIMIDSNNCGVDNRHGITSKGNYWNIALGVKYAIRNKYKFDKK